MLAPELPQAASRVQINLELDVISFCGHLEDEPGQANKSMLDKLHLLYSLLVQM